MTKKELVIWSILRDLLDLVGIGQIPPFNWMLSAPVQLMHFSYAGAKATTCLLEMIPLVGVLPIFTIAALSYPSKESGGGEPPPGSEGVAAGDRSQAAAETPQRVTAIPTTLSDPEHGRTLYTMVDGKLVPVVVPDQAVIVAEHAARALPSPERSL